MLTLCSPDHSLHCGARELIDGEFSPSHEDPVRVERILERIREVGLGPVEEPADAGIEPVARIHDTAYLAFLRGAHARWTARHGSSAALPHCWPARRLKASVPQEIDGQLGYYSFDAGTPITAGTWAAAYGAAQAAIAAATRLAANGDPVFALCRPPGHHAASDLYGGYCFLNNAAIAAQRLRDAGAARVAILDIDFHHGNGTQDIFYERGDVLFVSLHGDPAQEYPYFLGHADERGSGAGEGANLNLPLRWGTDWASWSEALETALAALARHAPEALVVSLGVDTYAGDPLSQFRLETEDFLRIGARLQRTGLPALFVLEGGYATDVLGHNVVNVLQGFSAD